MATTFYFPATANTSGLTPTISAEWEHQNAVRRDAVTVVDSSALATTAYTPDASDHIANGDAHHRQYITGPLAAQVIAAQAVTAQFQCTEAHANNNLQLTIKIFSIDSAGAVKDELLAITRNGTEPTTSLRNTSFSASTTERTVIRGDRLVFEIGFGGTPVATSGTQGHNGSIRWGCNASSGDLPVDNTQAGTTYRPWLKFANNIVLDTGITPTAGGVIVSGVAGVIGLALIASFGTADIQGYAPIVQKSDFVSITPPAGGLIIDTMIPPQDIGIVVPPMTVV